MENPNKNKSFDEDNRTRITVQWQDEKIQQRDMTFCAAEYAVAKTKVF